MLNEQFITKRKELGLGTSEMQLKAFEIAEEVVREAIFDPPQIVCDSYEQKGVFVPVERPTPKPILYVGVGFNSARGVTDEEIKDLLSETCTTIAAKTNNEYYVICVIDYTFEHGLNFKVL
jgi:hypothetical protein